MFKTEFTPFYPDTNSTNLPFYLLKDKRGNDIIYINDNNMIYLNEKNCDLSFQLEIYNKWLNQGICSIYKVSNELKIIKQQQNNIIYWFLIDQENQIELYQNYFNSLENVQLHFNAKYLCLTSKLYEDSIPLVVAGYDIERKKLLDCNDYKTSNLLYKAIVEARRCKFDCIYSIVKRKILLEDKLILYQFLSFVLNEEINDKNVQQAIEEARPYILKKCPNIIDIKINDNIEEVKNKNKDFGINYFYFNRIESKIENLKYIENKNYVKK